MTRKVTDLVLFNGESALITAVNFDGTVNLRVFHADGTDSAPAGVVLDADAPTQEQPTAGDAAAV